MCFPPISHIYIVTHRKISGECIHAELIKSSGKTIVRSIRIDISLDEAISKIAREKDVTPNSLISSALTKYVEWDEQIERYRFVSLPEEQFRAIVDSMAKKKARDLGTWLGPRLVKELLQFRFKKVTMESFIEHVRYLSKYSGTARAEIDTADGEWTLTYRHQLGEKWSAFVAAFYGEALSKLFSAIVQSDSSESQVIIKWKVGAPGPTAKKSASGAPSL